MEKTLKLNHQEVLKQLELTLKKGIEKKASDIHLKTGLPAIVRVNGNLYYLGGEEASDTNTRFSAEQLERLAYALMSPRQIQSYESGDEVDCGYEIPGVGRFRINICLQKSNPRLVCRYVPDQIPTIEELSLPAIVKELTMLHRGLVLVTGATGSGKSTTLASMIDEIAKSRSCHILTIEDPIEFSFKDRKSVITQREVGLDSKTFSKALKYALRQDPDVILVGEMRDEETIRMALTAAETGHLVLSTLHTLDAVETVNRILGTCSGDVQAQVREQLGAVLVGVISQRLVKKKDGKGRVVAVEVLISNARVRELILDPARTSELHKVIESSANVGMQSFDQCLLSLVQKGQITKEEALNNCSNIRDFHLHLDGVVGGEWTEGKNEKVETRSEQIQHIMDEEKSGKQIIEIDLLRKRK